MKSVFRRIVNKMIFNNSRLAYSQTGEDLVLAYLFHKRNISKPSYLDIGANHPCHNSNTFYFYQRGSRGICIEPNPRLYRKFKKIRPSDTVLNVGVGAADVEKAEFYVFPGAMDGLSTFSKADAMHWKEVGMENVGPVHYEKIIHVPVRSINSILDEFRGKTPDFVSLDVEGLDLEILQAIDFNKHRPYVFVVETLGYDTNQQEYKRTEIASFLAPKGYEVYADTRINTIFISP